jgi:Family of unknown function (DUF6232)
MPAPDHEVTTVQVRKKVLWIGSDAYPLQNIARAQARELLPPKRKSPVGPFVKSVVRWVLIGVAALVALSLAHVKSAAPRTLVWLVVAAFMALQPESGSVCGLLTVRD